MTDARATLAIIDEFVELAAERRQRALPADRRARMELLDESLRELIDGAKPAPKRIENPSAAGGAPSTPGAPAPPAAKPEPEKPRATMANALSDALELSRTDQTKVRDVKVGTDNAYTPPSAPAYMQDYFSEDIVPLASTRDLVPTNVINAEGESVDLSREVRVLLGLEKPQPVVERAPSVAPTPRARVASAAPPKKGSPVIVHMMAGGTKRGQIERFEPTSGSVSVTGKDGSQEDVTLQDVLAIFFGARRGQDSIESSGVGIVVKLVNDRQLSGLSPDYSEGADALTVVPSPKRGNIDHIWVPAWAVKAVELT